MQQQDADDVDQHLAEADDALQQFRALGQVLEARLKLLAAGGQQQPDGDDGGTSSSTATPADADAGGTAGCQQQQQQQQPCAGTLLAAQDSSQLQPQPQQLPPAWQQQVQHEKQLLQARQKQAAAAAAARSKQRLSQQQAAAWQEAQQQLPFQAPQGQVSSKVSHKLHKTLSLILRSSQAAGVLPDAGALLPHCTETLAAAAAADVPHSSMSRGDGTSSGRPGALQLAPAAATAAAAQPHAATISGSSRNDTTNTNSSSCAEHSPSGRQHISRRSGAGRQQLLTAGDSKQQAWAAADAVTDAEVSTYLLGHWQQQHMPTAALVLQCAWRSRVARLAFGRYLRKRHASTRAALQPAFLQWHSWSKAARHHRQRQQRVVLCGWQELLQLQLQLCAKLLRGLQRGVLSGDVPALMVWRLCTSSQQQLSAVRPSLGGMLASILLQRVPRIRQQEHFQAWRQLCQSQAALRARAHRMLVAVLRAVGREQLRQAVRFWRMWTACRLCERFQLQLPALTRPCDAFDAWLWRHERGQQLRQQAAGLAGRLGLMRSFANWHRHVHKMRAMRAAWSGLVLHTPGELVRTGLNAFKATWREERLHRRLLRSAVVAWADLVDRNRAVAAVRSRIKQVAEARRKAAGLAAFRRFRRMSQLLSAAAMLKQWHARALVLAHMHAWLGDTLHTTFYLCWWRWRRRAVSRVRWRAALGLHMYRAHWVHLELVFCGWRKAAAAGKQLLLLLPPQQASDCAAAAAAADEAEQRQQLSSSAAVAPEEPPDAQQAASHDACDESSLGELSSSSSSSCCDTRADNAIVHASLADFPMCQAWRSLQQRRSVLAPQGLRRLTGLRLGRAVRDLSELEGGFMAKDSDSDACGWLSSRVFARAGVSPGLRAMVNAQLPMHVLWRTSFPADAFWWQRIVGLMHHHVPHPDSWRALITPQHSTHTGTSSSQHATDPAVDAADGCLQDFLDPANSTCSHRCSCSRCHMHVPAQAAVAPEAAAKPAVDAAASMARARLRLRTGLALQPLQVPGAATGGTPTSTAAPTPAAAAAAVRVTDSPTVSRSPSPDGPHEQAAAEAAAGVPAAGPSSTSAPQAGGGSSSGVCDRSSSASCSSSSAEGVGAKGRAQADCWPAGWTCGDVAGLCRLAQAEELLETAVHVLLGLGGDSSTELYDKLQQMTRGQALSLQGDLLTWLLSAAVAHDTAHSRSVLCHARARDELLVATMELRERAMALHLHIPHRFTLNCRREGLDLRASWAAIIARVEQEQDWDASSAEGSEGDPREQRWASLLAHDPHQQQQQQQQVPWAPGQHLQAASGGPSRSHSPQGLPNAAAAATVAAGGPNAAQAAVMALANAAAGPRLRTSKAPGAAELAPGIMLAQATPAAPAGGLWTPEHASRSHTPAPDASTQQQTEFQQQQQKKRQKHQRQQKQAMAAAQGLFGAVKHGAAADAAVDGSANSPLCIAAYNGTARGLQAMGAGEDEAIFTGPGFLPLPQAGLAATGSHSSVPAGPPASSRSVTGSGTAGSTLPNSSEAAGQHGSNAAVDAATASDAAAAGGSVHASGSSSGPQAAAAQLAASGVAIDGSTVLDGVQPAVGALDPKAAPLLRAELQELLTDILASGLGLPADGAGTDPAAAAPGAAAGDGGAGVQSQCGADASAQSSSNSGGSMGGSRLQSARSAAESLAGAFADWVMQPAQQQQQQRAQAERSAASASSLMPVKPSSAPSTVLKHHRPGSSGSTGSDVSMGGGSSGCSTPRHSHCARALSASANLQPTKTANVTGDGRRCSSTSSSTSSSSTSHRASALTAAAALDANGGSEDSPWAALAVAQGLLDPSEAGLLANRSTAQPDHEHALRLGSQQRHAASCSSTSAEDSVTAEPSAGVPADQASQEPSSSCSSLPSIPSIQGSPMQQQQAQAGRGKGCSTTRHAAAGAGPEHAADKPCLPPINSATRPPPQQQRSKQMPQQCPESGSLQLPPPPLPPRQPDLSAQQMLPQVAAALQPQPGGGMQPSLEGMQQALSLLQPEELQQQLEMLLRAQRQNACMHQQQQQQQQHQEEQFEPMHVLPWGGEMLVGPAVVLTHLRIASLSTRVAFWRQVTAQSADRPVSPPAQHNLQQTHGFAWVARSSSKLSHQLHQLAWSSLLLSGSTQTAQGTQQHQVVAPQGEAVGSSAALRDKLHTYLSARMQWRQQQQMAPPLAPAEKWVTLEHEEQVLEFITSLTIAVHQRLLRKHTGLPAAPAAAAAPFGSSTGRGHAAASSSLAAPPVADGGAASIAAAGRRADLSQAQRIEPTVPRQCQVPPVLRYVVPRPAACASAAALRERQEPLQGWHTVDREDEEALPARLPALWPQGQASCDPAVASVAAGAPDQPQPGLEHVRSFQSSESSWAG